MVSIEYILKKEYPKLFEYPDLISKSVVKISQWIVHENSINRFMAMHEQKTGLAFIDAALEHLNVSYKINNRQVENIPAIGKVIIIANHPLGALDALSLIQMVCHVRQDQKVKIVANKMLSSIPQLKEFLISVDNMNEKVSKYALRQIDTALRAEEAVIFFPSGEVSRGGMFGLKEGAWKGGFVKFAKRNNAPILPIFIRARNSSLFYTASWIYKPLGTLLLSHEMFAARNRVFDMTIGKLVSEKALNDFNLTDKHHAKLFRKHLLRIAKGKVGIYPTECSIAHPVSRQDIRAELKFGERIGTTSDNKHIYLIEHENAPNLINEIGRLREYSFRKVGEGSGKAKDLDEYDRYYHHLVLWDDEALEVVGAYRIGECGWILSWLGQEGLYLSDLCDINERFDPILEDAIELGRSFVQPKYWGTRALDYLWQGIGAYLSHNPHIKYMIGPVSISGSYPKHAQEALVYFYNLYFGSDHSYLKAKSPYRLSDFVEAEFGELFSGNNYTEDFRVLKDYLKTFDVAVPTLYKQYSELCEEGGAQFIDFGIDVDFNNCIDGYILVEIAKIKAVKRQRYIQAV
ncbi:MAG: lysophospholipid acyltransferase family protein [Sulfuricurvum sp.]|uniref:lysophospholipid acyltransferase family protein n=1 Tax=Sulfuricurvum sp. TaxID=2025608 RepID=UPI0025E78407|nr:GNAT family N-acyltransferase [Sulfuricurvum sp.]MCK9371983.1 lysophospholipid acyltransferase family protein [Sulfuricurvum sp.]